MHTRKIRQKLCFRTLGFSHPDPGNAVFFGDGIGFDACRRRSVVAVWVEHAASRTVELQAVIAAFDCIALDLSQIQGNKTKRATFKQGGNERKKGGVGK